MRKAGIVSILFVVVLLAVAVIAEAQQPKKVPHIGFLSGGYVLGGYPLELFSHALRQFGYAQGFCPGNAWVRRG